MRATESLSEIEGLVWTGDRQNSKNSAAMVEHPSQVGTVFVEAQPFIWDLQKHASTKLDVVHESPHLVVIMNERP